ncbi:hypothetical protein ACFQT0_22980 [Hymenobacter humi]|uniref:Uncharacterized protein n=1 Tax=Hymenobacter humi TaxID=1411620 RepID=A0ABW2UCH4_9BACT
MLRRTRLGQVPVVEGLHGRRQLVHRHLRDGAVAEEPPGAGGAVGKH